MPELQRLVALSIGKRNRLNYRDLCREVRRTLNERYPDTVTALKTQDSFVALIRARLHGRLLSKAMRAAVLAYAARAYSARLSS